MSLTIAAAQSKSFPGDIARNVEHHLRFGALAAAQGVQLLVFPELSLTGYELDLARSSAVRADCSLLHPLRRFAVDAQMTLAAGAPLLTDQGDLNIAALAFRPDGSVSLYCKVHVHESELHVFTPGPGGPMLRIEDQSIALAICADVSHPEHVADAAWRGANIYAAGVMKSERDYARKAPLLKGYAVEHKLAVLMANYSGVSGGIVSAGRSAIWSEDGAVVVESAGTEEALIVGVKRDGAWRGSYLPLY